MSLGSPKNKTYPNGSAPLKRGFSEEENANRRPQPFI
jgi:hypothetical protein